MRPILRLPSQSVEKAPHQRWAVFALTSRNQQMLGKSVGWHVMRHLKEAQNIDNPLCLVISSPGDFPELAGLGGRWKVEKNLMVLKLQGNNNNYDITRNHRKKGRLN